MNDKEKYLKSGIQTEITSEIKKIANSFKEKDLYLILEILSLLKTNFIKHIRSDNKAWNNLFRKRIASEILTSKKETGCTDYALSFIVLARAKGIPTKYIEAINKEWLETGSSSYIKGHVFAECYINNKWYIIDPQYGAINVVFPDSFVIFKKGLDSWDIGIKSFKDLREKFTEFRNKQK